MESASLTRRSTASAAPRRAVLFALFLICFAALSCSVLGRGDAPPGPAEETARGFRYLEDENWYRAMGAFREALELDPDYPPARYGLGRVFTETGFTDGAEEEFLRAIAVDSAYGEAYLGLGNLYYRLGRAEESERRIRKAVRHGAGRSPETLYLLGLFAERRGDREEAESRYRDALETDPKDARTRFALIDLLRSLGRYEDALAELERERFPRGRENEVRLRLADCRLNLGQDLEAERIFRQLLNTDRSAMEPRWGLVRLALRRGDRFEAASRLGEIAETLPEQEGLLVSSLVDALDYPDPFFIFLCRCRKTLPLAPRPLAGRIEEMIAELSAGDRPEGEGPCDEGAAVHE